MRSTNWALTWSLSLTAILASALPALAYINGGDFINTIRQYPAELRADHWAVCCATELKPEPGEKPDPEKKANQLIVGALQSLSAEELKKVSLEDRQALAKVTQEAMQKGKVSEGKIGALKYRVGAYPYETYWYTDYLEGCTHIHARRKAGTVPFVAVKVVEE